MSLRAFMAQIPTERETEIVISDRFVDENGEKIQWKLKAISAAEDRKIKDACFKYASRPGKEQRVKEFDAFRYTAIQAAACVVYPDLNAAELQDYYQTKDPVECLEKMLLPEEMNRLQIEVNKLNGGNGLRAQVDEAKN